MIADALLLKHSCLWFIAVISLVFFHIVRAGAYWHKIHDVHTCAFAVKTKWSVISFGFLFQRLLWRHCKTFNIKTGKSVSFALVRAVVRNQKSPRGHVQGLLLVHFDPFCFCLF